MAYDIIKLFAALAQNSKTLNDYVPTNVGV